MKYLEVINAHGSLTEAQKFASEFYIRCEQTNKSIDFGAACASVYLDAFTSQEANILMQMGVQTRRYNIYPHDNQIEIWFI